MAERKLIKTLKTLTSSPAGLSWSKQERNFIQLAISYKYIHSSTFRIQFPIHKIISTQKHLESTQTWMNFNLTIIITIIPNITNYF